MKLHYNILRKFLSTKKEFSNKSLLKCPTFGHGFDAPKLETKAAR
jgi:hypothetical protein